LIISPYSTAGIENVYRGKPSMFMLLPGLGAASLKDSVGLETLPVIEDGASIGVFQEKDMKSELERLLDPKCQKIMKEAIHTYHHLDGDNTRRVVELIEKILNIKFNKE
jgi:hypothetical protein